jgi:hypothetical protein
MALKTRLAAVSRKLKVEPPPQILVRDVPYFEPGPDAEPNGQIRILVRNPQGEQRMLANLREYYDATVQREGDPL